MAVENKQYFPREVFPCSGYAAADRFVSDVSSEGRLKEGRLIKAVEAPFALDLSGKRSRVPVPPCYNGVKWLRSYSQVNVDFMHCRSTEPENRDGIRACRCNRKCHEGQRAGTGHRIWAEHGENSGRRIQREQVDRAVETSLRGNFDRGCCGSALRHGQAAWERRK